MWEFEPSKKDELGLLKVNLRANRQLAQSVVCSNHLFQRLKNGKEQIIFVMITHEQASLILIIICLNFAMPLSGMHTS